MSHMKSTDILSPPEIILSMKFWDSVFPAAMRKLEEEFEEPKNRPGSNYSIRGLDNWDQVYQKLEDCFKKYIDETGIVRRAKKGWQEFSDRIGPLQEAWKLVPDIDYLTPIRGTLEFIIDAIKRASETRQHVLHGLDNLSSLFKDIEFYLALFPVDENVLDAGTAVVLSALVAVEKLIGFYLKPRTRKAISALFRGDDYEKDVISSLNDITRKSEDLCSEAEKADMRKSTNNWREAKERHEELINLQTTVINSQRELLQKQGLHANNLIKAYEVIQAIPNEVYNLIREYERNQEQKWQDAFKRKFSEMNDTVQCALALDPVALKRCIITLDDIWEIFGALYFEDTDFQRILHKQEKIPAHEKALAESLVTNPRFRQWMISPMSQKLLVQGNLINDRCVSSQSIFCSKFLQLLRGNSRFISLLYFCGLHSEHNDPYSGPRGMMMSFIAQLVLQWDFDTTGIHQAVGFLWDEYCDEPDIKNLCILVSWLVVQLPTDITVFCIMDGINAYEKEGYLPDLVCGLACILDWTIDPRVNATVKVLVTSPCRTLEVREGFHDDAVLVMSDQLGLSGEANQRLLQHRMSRAFRNGED